MARQSYERSEVRFYQGNFKNYIFKILELYLTLIQKIITDPTFSKCYDLAPIS